MPGVYIVHLTVVDANGLSSDDYAAVSVLKADGTEAPRVRLYADPSIAEPDANGELTVQFFCDARPASSYTYDWDFGDGSPGRSGTNEWRPTHTYTVGADGKRELEAHCRITDDTFESGDRVTVTLTANGKLPPRILSLGATEVCANEPYHYDQDDRAAARGAGGLIWRLGKVVGTSMFGAPAGFDLDPTTGIITWTPSTDQIGTQNVFLRAENGVADGTDVQEFDVEVQECALVDPPLPPVPNGCGCRDTGNSAALLWLVLLGLLPWRRRRVTRRPH